MSLFHRYLKTCPCDKCVHETNLMKFYDDNERRVFEYLMGLSLKFIRFIANKINLLSEKLDRILK